MRDGTQLFTAVYVPERPLNAYPIMLDAHALQRRRPTGRMPTRARLGPSPLFAKEGYIFVYQDVRGRYMSEGEFVNMRPHSAGQDAARRTSTRAPTPTTRSTGSSRTSPNNNGKVGHVGHLLPRLLHRGGHDRRPPGPEGRLAAGADRRLVRRRRLPPQRRVLPAARLQLHRQLRPPAARADHDRAARRSTTARPTATTSSWTWARCRTSNAKYFKGDIAFWNEMMKHGNYDEFWQARNLLPHLKNVTPAVMTVGGWFDAEDLYGALKTYQEVEREQPRHRQHPRHGPVVARRLGGRRRRRARRRPLRRQDASAIYREQDRVAVLRATT